MADALILGVATADLALASAVRAHAALHALVCVDLTPPWGSDGPTLKPDLCVADAAQLQDGSAVARLAPALWLLPWAAATPPPAALQQHLLLPLVAQGGYSDADHLALTQLLRLGSEILHLRRQVHADLVDRKSTEARLLVETFHDALTSLPNTAMLRERLQRAAACAARPDAYAYAVLFIDLDGFKNINDSLGHVEGDHLLVGVAERLRNCVRPQDLVARLGGDKFAILLDPVAAPSDASHTAERIQRALALPFYVGEQELCASVSIGIAHSTPAPADPYDLVRNADTAMFHAKRRKHGFYEVFDASMRTRAVARLGLENSLRRAIGRQELRLEYQPVVRISDRQLVGFEALVRWHSGERGLISPSDFIPLAEETGLILPIGRWVLREACAQTQRWHQLHPRSEPLFISVNVSVRQFSQGDIVEQVAAVLAETGLAPTQLKLEVTESLLIDNVQSTAVLLRRLEAMQIRLCMDDFGTGYSSLSTLYQLPIHTLKIDRSFVTGLGADNQHAKVVETIILLAHNLQMSVIAEGIETELEWQSLAALGCDFGQGYLIARPLVPAAAEAMLR